MNGSGMIWIWDERICSAAAEGGHLEVLQRARQQGCPWDEETCRTAGERWHLEVLQWARQQGCPWDVKTKDLQGSSWGRAPLDVVMGQAAGVLLG
jgi:hypothetical protein